MTKNTKRARRSPDQMIEDLQKQIEQVKRRAAQRKVKTDPALRHVAGAIRSIDKALAASKDAATKEALGEARASLSAVLTLSGVVLPKATGRSAGAKVSSGAKLAPDVVLDYLRKNSGSRTEHMAAALGTDSAGLRPALNTLKAAGKIETKGQARATRYFVAGSK